MNEIETTRRPAVLTMIILFVVIMVLPFLVYSDSFIIGFLEQPILIFVPTAIISGIYIKKTEGSVVDFYRIKKLSAKNILILTAIVVLLPAIVNVIVEITSIFFSSPYYDDVVLKPEMHDGVLWAICVFFYSSFFNAVFPGICEEVLFRGSMLRLSEKAGFNTGLIIVLNALLFAIFHFNIMQLFYTFAIGLVLASVVLATDSILAGIYVHILYNFIISLSEIFDLSKHSIIASIDNMFYNMNSIVFAVFIVMVIVQLIRHLDKENNVKIEQKINIEE